MSGIGEIMMVISAVSAVASVTTSAIAASKKPPEVPGLDDKNIQAKRRAAIAQAQHSFGLSNTRIAPENSVGSTLAQGNTIIGGSSSPGAESNI